MALFFNARLAFFEPRNSIWNFAGFSTRELFPYSPEMIMVPPSRALISKF